ncbi:MAG: hypothetical protein H0W78_15385 [Planctomycetes bacterium]|jgi:hypothetical protein|nr:hypothetical protein [Planctomycetota bacterium]
MRHLTIALIAITFLALTACGGGGSGRQTEQKLSLEQAPTATNDAGLKASITYYKQSDRYLIVKLSLTNESKETITVKNGDSTALPGFRATVEGQTFIAELKGGSWNPWTGYRPPTGGGSNNLEIPAGITANIDVRWNFQMARKDYDWVVVVSNLQAGEKKLSDIALSWPPKAAAPAATK